MECSTTSPAQTCPVLPPELELAIFELAFDPTDFSSSLKYMLVAKRVYEWIRPLLFRVFDQIDRPPFPDFEAHKDMLNIAEIGPFAHHLVIGRIHTSLDACTMIRHMPNIRDLAIWYGLNMKPIIPALEGLENLQRLSCGLNGLDSDQLLLPAFTNLTHLELLTPRNDWDFKVLESYKRLTHLSVYGAKDWECDTVETVLRSCVNLKVFVLTEDCRLGVPEDIRNMCESHHTLLIFSNDVACHKDWKRGAYGGDDYWVLAERLVDARKRGFFKKEHYDFGYISTKNEWRDHLTEDGEAWFDKLPPLRDMSHMVLNWADRRD
ncbi:hypothetical protein CVT24_009748 [Panaeolus cyanescens]|uniref:F-box domain-containing protein n=1 Tax=Panaeolus cyanescens TaxID=181874 RepID=A0A409Y9B5_9AGAR|nr:hypothetical protein CVT24_009748 [Panaeolus cyanescens]